MRRRGCARPTVRADQGTAVARPVRRGASEGQSLVEFALVIGLFLVLTLGFMDTARAVFYYNQVQETARMGARWGAVQVARALPNNPASTPYGTFSSTGNRSGTYCASGCDYTLQGSRAITTTAPMTQSIVGASLQVATLLTLSQTTVTISTSMPTTTTESLPTDGQFTNKPVSVSVSYRFTPILGMVLGGQALTLTGTSTILHE